MTLREEIRLKAEKAKKKLREEMEKRKVKMPLMETLMIRKEDGEEVSLFEKEWIFTEAKGEIPLKNVILRIEKREYIPIPQIRILEGKKVEIGFVIPIPKKELIREIKSGKKEFAEYPYSLIDEHFIPLEKLNLEKSFKEMGKEMIEDFEREHIEEHLKDLEEFKEISPALFSVFYDDEMLMDVENPYLEKFLLSEKVLNALKEYLEENHI